MLILTSPAKTLDLKSEVPLIRSSVPEFISEASKLQEYLDNLSLPELRKLLETSEKLAVLNFDRFKNWSENHNNKNSRPALFTYKGHVFQQLDLENYSDKELNYSQKSLRIITGLYGVLKALDLIQPYRLEMANKLRVDGHKTLQSFWMDKITESLNEEIKKENHKYLINVASKEYSNAIDFKALNCEYFHIDFKQKRDGIVKTIGLYAKKARGLMIDYCIKNNIKTIEEVKNFCEEGYTLLDGKDNKLTFLKDIK